jgi:hypothetical protein
VTLRKNEGLALLEEALREVERVIKGKGGTYKLSSGPQIIGDSAKDKDIDDIMKMPGEHGDSDDDASGEEDNDEGMGDQDFGEDGEERKEDDDLGKGDGLDEDEVDEDGEEKKVAAKPKKVKKSKKSKKESDDEDDQ